MKGDKNIFNLFRSFSYRSHNKSSYFPHFGLDLFTGRFGSGKTLSVVNLVTNIKDKFPNCHLISNVKFNCYTNDKTVHFTDLEDDFLYQLVNIFKNIDIDDGVIVLIDEVQLFLLKTLDTPSSPQYRAFFAILGQLRKLRCLFILTSQLYSRVPKVLRDYIILNGNIINCKKLISGITLYARYDMEDIKEDSKCKLVGKFKSYDFVIHSPELYDAYNSYAVVSGISGLLTDFKQRGDINASNNV